MFPLASRPVPPLSEATGFARDRALARAPQAEWGLAHQGARLLLTSDHMSGWLVRHAGRSLVALGLPLGPASLAELARTARAQGRMPLLYKCDRETALRARRAGWQVLRLGHEAILDLGGWSLDRPACRQLRRKLRAADKAGVQATMGPDLPIRAMEAVALDWSNRHGGQKGFSMGRFEPGYLRHQRVLLAWVGGVLVAFATFHATPEEWTLDLMRHVEDAPAGTMHRLVAEAASLARAEGAARLSLAAIPEAQVVATAPVLRGHRPCGLAQFKTCFGPRLAPRYAAAPGWLSLGLGLAAVAWAIHRPEPIESRTEAPQLASRPGQRARCLETGRTWPHFAFDPARVPCDAPPAKLRPVASFLSGRRPPFWKA